MEAASPASNGGAAAGIPGAWAQRGSGSSHACRATLGYSGGVRAPMRILNWIWDGHCADVGRGFSRRCGIGDRLFVAGRNRPSSRGAALAREQPAPGCGTRLGTDALRHATHSFTRHAETAGRRPPASGWGFRRPRAAARAPGNLPTSNSAGSQRVRGGRSFRRLGPRRCGIP